MSHRKPLIVSPKKATKWTRDCIRDALLNLRTCPYDEWTQDMRQLDEQLRSTLLLCDPAE